LGYADHAEPASCRPQNQKHAIEKIASHPTQFNHPSYGRNHNMIKKITIPGETTFQSDMVQIDPATFESHVDNQPFAIQHKLQQHPLFQLENLVELSKRLPRKQREYVFSKQEFGTHEDLEHYKHAADNDELSTDELIKAIEHQNIVIVLRNVESDSIYGQFVNECLDSLGEFVEPVTGKISGRESFIFVSPPQAYTPYHYDPEQNFFMQIRGKKQMAIYDVNDRDVLPEEALEKFYNEGQRITNCSDSLFEQHQLFEMNPGDGVYVPVTAPHWVRTLGEISISVSINFRTPSSIRRDRVYRMNRMLRKAGLRPHPVSTQANTWSELTKSALLGGPATIKNLVRK
jgi:hypothetical protein